MTLRLSTPRLAVFILVAASQDSNPQSPTLVTLTPTTSPAAGEPGVTNISVTGSNFPTGTIPAANVTVSLKPSGGAAVTTAAGAVATVVGSTRRVSFTIPASVQVSAPTAYTVTLSGTTSTNVAFSSSNTAALTVNPVASLSSVTPNTGQTGQGLSVSVSGNFSNFLQAATVPSFGAGITINSTTVTNATQASVSVTIGSAAATGPRTVTMTTGAEVATLVNGFTVTAATSPPPTITDFNPKTGSSGTLVTITGTNLQPNSGTSAQVSIAKQSGGTLSITASSTTSTSLTFVIPAGAATGVVGATVNGGSASTAEPLTIVPASGFTLTANPPSANLIQGQSVAYSVQLSGTNGFNQLGQLSVAGIPSGVTASFNPLGITSGQTAVLTLTAPSGQATGTANLTIAAAATVGGLPVNQSTPVSVSVVAPTTTLLGRTVVSDSAETPLAGVTIKTLGLDGNGNTTGCTGHSTVSDAAGNFSLGNLPAQCTGPQLISFDGTTASAPPGQYAGVNLVFTLSQGQVTASPVLVHLPRIDNVETFYVTQNSAVNQNYSYTSIPGLSVTVYAGTLFTLQNGTQPNPFPLAAIQVPVDRLPDAKPQVPTMMRAFIVAFQPANATTNEPVAVYFPNTLSTPPGTDMALMTLDPMHGQMVPYGTGAVSSDGTQIVPDPDPAHPGHLYGLVHFDWHGPMPPPPPQSNPGPPGSGSGGSGPCPVGGLGPGPGGGLGPGGGSCLMPGQPTTTPTPPPSDNPGFCPIAALSDWNEIPDFLKRDDRAEAGDPVDLFSGIMVLTNTDITIPGSRGSVSLVRTYRSLSGNAGSFGIGTGHNYSLQLSTASLVRGGQGVLPLVMSDGNQYLFTLQPNGTFINTTIPALAGAVLSANAAAGTYSLRWKNGTVYGFQTSSLGALEAFLTSITDRNGNRITLTLNPSQPLQITQITDPVGRSLTLNYDSSNRITSVTDPTGRSVQYTYNSQGTLATVTDPAGGITQYAYDSNNNMIQVTDPRGIVQAQNTLDAAGRVIKQVRPDGGTLSFLYTFLNPLAATSEAMDTQVSDSQGVVAFYRFNPNGFVTDIIATGGQKRLLPRAAGSNFLTSVTESSSTQTYTYDSNGNILSSTDATSLTTQFAYEPVFNKVTSITDPLGNITHFAYDGNGNLLTQTDANGHVTQYRYDPTGVVTQSTDALGQKTTFAYDSFGNLTTVTDPLGNISSYAYDAISRLIQTTDSLGRRTTFTYDPLGRLLTRTNAQGGVTAFTYDPNGNLLSVKDARGNTTTFTYDVMNRLTTRTDALGHSDSRTYDTNGNLIQFVDRRGQTSAFGYDNLNRLVTQTYPDATVARTYDVYGRLAQATDSASGALTFSYDLAGRLLSSSNANGTVNYAYDGRGEMSSRQVAGQPAVSYAYDPTGNLTSAAMPQASASFAYDARNELSAINRQNGVNSVYSYDPDARLLGITHTSGASTLDVETYAYDAVGNRGPHTTSLGQALVTPATTNQYNAANQLTLFGSVPNSYDTNGNLLEQGTSTGYTWDGRNRLKSIVTAAGQTTNFTYDVVGNLIQQADSGTSLNLTRTFVLDDLTNVAYEAASDGTSYSVLSGRSLDSHLAIAQSSGQVQYGLADGINSTIAAVDQGGTIQSRYLYESFGQTTTTGTYPFQFAGRTPVSNNLYYNRARFYNANTGRFLSEDPIGFSGGNVNLYAYVRNNPVRRVDPFGLTDILTGPLQPSQDTQNPPSNPSGCSVAGNFVQCMVTEELKGQPISKAADLAVGMCPFAETPLTAAVCITGFLYKTTEIPQTLIEAGQCYQEAQSQCAGCAYMQNFKWKLPQ